MIFSLFHDLCRFQIKTCRRFARILSQAKAVLTTRAKKARKEVPTQD